MIIPSKHSGYGEGGRLTSTRRVYDSGGGSATQTQITDLPDWAKPTAEGLLKDAGQLTDINKNPYTPYAGQRTAQFTPLQQQASAFLCCPRSPLQWPSSLHLRW